MKTKGDRVLRYALGQPWPVVPEKLDAIADVASRWAAGAGPQSSIVPKAAQPTAKRVAGGTVALLPLFGVIGRRMNMLMEISGGTSTEKFLEDYRGALADESVSSVVIDVDSPGGSSDGVEELSDELRALRGQKPVIAIADTMMASAAYWIASAAADELWATPSSQVGSIGVWALHVDFSKQNQMIGVEPTYISAGKFKVEANPDEPLGDDARAHLQELVDDVYSAFVKSVAASRGATAAAVRAGYGEGRVLAARAAKKEKLVDRVGNLGEAVMRASRLGGRSARNRRAEKWLQETGDSAQGVGRNHREVEE